MIDIRLLNDASKIRVYKAGQRIAPAPGENEMYVLISGRADRFDLGPDNKFAPNGSAFPGQSFGKREYFVGDAQSVFAAGTDSIVFVINEETFLSLAKTKPEVVYGLLRQAYFPCGAQESPKAAETTGAAGSKREALMEKLKGKPGSAGGGNYPVALFPKGYSGYSGVTHPEYAQYLYEAEYTCPNCGHAYKGPRVFASKLVAASPMRYDLKKGFRDFDTAWYDIITCPNCYFSMFSDYFTEPKTLNKQKIQQALNEAKSAYPLDFAAERNLDFVLAAHFLALRCAPGYANEKQLSMRLWASVSWLFEDIEDAEMARMAAGQSAEAGYKVYMASDLSPQQEQIISLSNAGMTYRSGGPKEEVLKWLQRVKLMKDGKKVYAELADKLLELVRGKR